MHKNLLFIVCIALSACAHQRVDTYDDGAYQKTQYIEQPVLASAPVYSYGPPIDIGADDNIKNLTENDVKYFDNWKVSKVTVANYPPQIHIITPVPLRNPLINGGAFTIVLYKSSGRIGYSFQMMFPNYINAPGGIIENGYVTFMVNNNALQIGRETFRQGPLLTTIFHGDIKLINLLKSGSNLIIKLGDNPSSGSFAISLNGFINALDYAYILANQF